MRMFLTIAAVTIEIAFFSLIVGALAFWFFLTANGQNPFL